MIGITTALSKNTSLFHLLSICGDTAGEENSHKDKLISFRENRLKTWNLKLLTDGQSDVCLYPTEVTRNPKYPTLIILPPRKNTMM